MELKKLELFGFKSFADRTRFEFDSGVTVIVGPNGCGKSNVVDAVKWVLGEQSAKSLRGREMADVIFAGSESRRSLGFAEATLVFDNSRGLLPIGVAEVEVTRRLYRSGESEYLLNRKPCRLRDLRELFMDTGIGVDAYSLIEQGKVDILLQSNPLERRAIFEEAAGISKYKSKRREAQRKLERTEQNLLRLGDILEEVDRRLRSVKYQAGKARSYLQYTERLKELRLSYALNQYHEQVTALAAHEAEIAARQDRRAERAAALAALDQTRAGLESELMGLEDAARQADSRLGEVRSGIASHDSEIGFHRTRVGELQEIVERDRRKIADLTGRLRQMEADVADRRRDLQAVGQRARVQEEAVARIEASLREVSDQVRALAGRIENAKAAVMDLAHERSQRASRQASLAMRLENLQAQSARLQARRDEVGAGLARLGEREAHLAAERQTLQAALAERRGRLDERRRAAETKQAELEATGQRLARAKEHTSALVSRRELLEDLQKRGEGIPAAVRRARQAIQESGRADQWRGMVADLIEVDVAHAVFIESALGPAEKLLVADHQADVLDLAHQLEGGLPGQVRFLAMDALAPAGDGRDLSAYPEAVGWAMDYLRVAEPVRPAIAHLLARTVVVRTLQGAVDLARGPLRGYRFVTLAGHVLEADGQIAVGPPGPETSLISRRAELRAIEVEHETVARQIQDLDTLRQQALQVLQQLDEEQQHLRQEIYEASMANVEVEGQVRRLADSRRELQAEAPLLESELADLAAQDREARAEHETVGRELADLQARAAQQEAAAAALAAEQDQALQHRSALEEERTAARVALAHLREKHAALGDQVAAAERDRQAAADGIEQGRQDLAQCLDRIRESDRAMLRLQGLLAALYLEKESVEAEVRRVAQARADRRAHAAELADKARALEAEVEAIQTEIHALELEGRELKTKQDDLVLRVRDDFGVELAERYAGWQPSQVDWNAVAEEIKDLAARIERLGAVNLEAIPEQEALEGRATFLHKQNDDLVAARKALQDLIERIDRESRQRFLATFEAVRGHFQELFRKLFGGGKADVFLENPEDVLETGIEVVARPPGKQLQRISLLSGGEKTMTAVALLLAVFRARPSPFCILDEVDAALDETNVDRFAALVKEFLDQSQFVIISHNKRTMHMADVLYGITMEEPGVSRKVSVKFSDLSEEGYVAEGVEPADAPVFAEAQAPAVAPTPVEVAAALAHAPEPVERPVEDAVEQRAEDAVERPAEGAVERRAEGAVERRAEARRDVSSGAAPPAAEPASGAAPPAAEPAPATESLAPEPPVFPEPVPAK